MITNSTSRPQGPTTQQARNARRVAILVLVAVAPSTGLFGFLAYQSAAWQLVAETVIMFAYGIAALIGLGLIRRGRVQLGMQIILYGMGLGLLALNMLVAGLGVLLGIAAGLLITAIATLTLPEPVATPTIVISFGLGLFIVLLDALLPAYRLSVPELTAYVPAVIVILASVCIYLIARQFGSYSMRGKLTLTLLLVAIVPIILQAVAFSFLAQSRLTSIGQQNLLAAATQTAGRIDRFLKDGALDIQVSARLPEVIDLLSTPADQRNLTKVANIFDALSSKNLFIRSYAVFDTAGVDVFDTRRLYIGKNQLDQPYIQTPLQTGQPYVSDVLFDDLIDEGLIHFSAPVRTASGDLIGIAQVAYSIAALQELVAQSSNLEVTGQFGLLFDENHFRLADGTITTRPPFKLTMPLTPEQLATLRAAKRLPEGDMAELAANLPELEAGLANAETQPFFVAEAGKTVVDVESSNLPDQMAAFKVPARNWYVVFGQTQQSLLAPITDLARSSLFLVLAISAVTIFFAARVSRALAHPILSLNEAAGKIAQGDLSVRATVDTADEIGALASTFNSMTEQISNLIGSLEQKVSDRTKQLRASAEVGRATTSILDIQQLLHEAVELISQRFGFYYAAIFTLSHDGQYAVLREATGEAGHTLKDRGHKLAVNDSSMVGSAITLQQARIALDVGQGAVRFANPLLPHTRSEIALPLIVGDRVIGALDVQSTQAAAFDEASVELLQNMANQVAIALTNAETLEQSQRQAHTLAVLNQASRDLAQATSLDGITRAAAQTVVQLLGPNSLSLAFKSADANSITVRSISLPTDQVPGEAWSLLLVNTFIGQVITGGKTFYTPDVSELASRYQDAATFSKAQLHSMCAVPLRVGDRILGTLNVGNEQLNRYTPEQLNQLEQVAAQLAVALENYNLAEQTRQALKELDEANRRLIGQVWQKYQAAGGAMVGQWREGTWQRLTADGAASDIAQSATEHALKLPLRVRGETIGEFEFAAGRESGDWSPDDVTFAQTLIDQVGQAIENARLIEETERFAHREQSIREITTRIRAAGNIQGVLEATAVELAQSMGVPRAIVRLTTASTVPDAHRPSQTDDN